MSENFFKQTNKINLKWVSLAIIMAISYISIVFYKQYKLLHTFGFPDFDISIFNQGIWLLSRFQRPFVTVRGLHFFGDHTTFINIIFVPIYWVYDSPLVLLFGETLLIGIGGFLLFLIAEKQLNSNLAAIIISFLYFSYPALHYVNFFNYHADIFAIPAVFLLWLGYLNNNKKLLYFSSGILILTKEIMPLILIGLGIYLYFVKKWKPAKWLPVIGIISSILLSLLMTYFNETGLLRTDMVIGSLSEVLKGNIKLTDFLYKNVITKENKKYLIELFMPVGFIPIFNPLVIILNPLFLQNLIADWPYAHSIQYQYPAQIIGTIFISLVESLCLIKVLIEKAGERYKRKYIKLQEILLTQFNEITDLNKKLNEDKINNAALPEALKAPFNMIQGKIELLTKKIINIEQNLKTFILNNPHKEKNLTMDIIDKRIRNFRLAIFTAIIIILTATTVYSNLSIDHPLMKVGNLLKKDLKIDYQLMDEIYGIKSEIGDKSISVSNILLPFFSSRKEIFLWKNPFKNEYYGPTYTETYEKKPLYILLHKDISNNPEDLKIVKDNHYKLIKEYDKLKLFYKTNLESPTDSDSIPLLPPIDMKSTSALQRTIQQGKKNKRIFIDISHGELDPNFKVLMSSWGYNPISPQSGFQGNKEKLFQSGILMMSYRIGGGELSKEEIETIKQYIASGGSLFLLCPVWVWKAYDHKPLELNPYHQIGKLYGLLLVEEYPKGKLIPSQNTIKANLDIDPQNWGGVFSRIISLNTSGISLIEDQDKKSFAMASVLGKSKLILMGHNILAKSSIYQNNPSLSAYTRKLFDWLNRN